MRILLIGNGFDIEHNLATKYTDFLDFAEWVNLINDSGMSDASVKALRLFYDTYKEEIRDEKLIEELKRNVCDNSWLKYFSRRRKDIGTGWIDFECEISIIVNLFEKAREDYLEREPFGTYQVSMTDLFREYYLYFHNNTIKSIIDGSEIESERKKLQDDLNNLIRALEIYIAYWVDNTIVKSINPSIAEIHPDKIISFNYSHTFNRVYGKSDFDMECCYIHGEAKREGSIATNNMVLGIDDKDEKNETEQSSCVTFYKKIFQRLCKKTDTTYLKWIKEISESDEKLELFIFGHSLDVTDKDILAAFIGHKKAITTIFYRNEKDKEDKLANMWKYINKKYIAEQMQKGNIVFERQAESKEFKNSEVEVRSDYLDLYTVLRRPFMEIDGIVKKIDQKIKAGSVSYFRNLSNVVSVYDALLLSNLINKEKEARLLEISKAIVEKQSDVKPLNPQEWAEPTVSGLLIPPKATKEFINTVNQYIEEKKARKKKSAFEIFCNRVIDYDKPEEYEKTFEAAYDFCEKQKMFDVRIMEKLSDWISNNPDCARAGLDSFDETTAKGKIIKTYYRRCIFSSAINDHIEVHRYKKLSSEK